MAEVPSAVVLTKIKALGIQYDAKLRGKDPVNKKMHLILCTLFAAHKRPCTFREGFSTFPKRQRLCRFPSFVFCPSLGPSRIFPIGEHLLSRHVIQNHIIPLTPHTVSRIFGVAAASSFALLTVVSGYLPLGVADHLHKSSFCDSQSQLRMIFLVYPWSIFLA